MKWIKNLLINGMVLAAASVILRFADVVFNAYISRRIGTEGMERQRRRGQGTAHQHRDGAEQRDDGAAERREQLDGDG